MHVLLRVGFIFLFLATPLSAAISESQVLVVYNSASTDATTVANAYLGARTGIPAANVLDLNNATIANTATVSYADFVTHIRAPLRNHLNQAGTPDPEDIIAIVLIRGIPHRVDDTDVTAVGDDPPATGDELNAGDMTGASVDAELVLLWQDLESGEAGGTMDSKSDNLIDNPYHASSTAIDSFNRARITNTKSFNNVANIAWSIGGFGPSRLTPGDLYLVCRIDGTTASEAISVIDRGQSPTVNKKYGWIVLDEDGRSNQFDDDFIFNPPLFSDTPDYENTRDLFQAAGWNVWYDATADFIDSTDLPHPVIGYASYGENHSPSPPGSGVYISNFQFPPGATFNTIESWNGRKFNGLSSFGQEQVADFIAVGGTFGIGQVWEPFSFSLPDNEFLMENLYLNGMTFAEAAYSSIPALSWMQVVVGDPLSTVQVVDQVADFDADGDVDFDDRDYLIDCATGPALGPVAAGCEAADLDLDDDVDSADFGLFQPCLSIGTAPDPGCLN